MPITNTGDTRWLANIEGQAGWAGLGGHLYKGAEGTTVLDFDWYRSRLPKDVDPGEQVTIDVELPGIAEPGTYRAVFDFVAEGVMWFAQHESPTTEVRLIVSP